MHTLINLCVIKIQIFYIFYCICLNISYSENGSKEAVSLSKIKHSEFFINILAIPNFCHCPPQIIVSLLQTNIPLVAHIDLVIYL